MTSTQLDFKSMVIGLLLGAGVVAAIGQATAEPDPTPRGPGPYQLSSYATQEFHGAYILDTNTGALWHRAQRESRDRVLMKLGNLEKPRLEIVPLSN